MPRVLYIGLDYYHYPKMICQEMENIGYEVDFYPIEPRSFFYKASRYLAKKSYKDNLDKYHQKIIKQTRATHYEKVFFITSHFMSIENLEALKKVHSAAQFIAYHWDNISQYNYLKTIPFFEKVYSFDRDDCEKHGFNYLPLFASGNYSKVIQDNVLPNVDIYTVGSIVQPERYILVNEFREFCMENNITFYFYLKVTPVTFLRLLMKGIIPKNVSFTSINTKKLQSVIARSRAVLDVTNHKQSGLTMRVIENIYIGKKVVTTNENIKFESFYSSKQVFILPVEKFDVFQSFLENEYIPMKFSELSINSWIKKVLL